MTSVRTSKMNALPFFISIAFVVFFSEAAGQSAHAPAFSITVAIGNLQSNNGKVMIALYNSEETYMKTRYKDAIAEIKDLKSSAVFAGIPAGTYAISIFHDENDNNELDSNRMRIPTEPYGFSNNARGLMGPASYDDASFKVQENVEIRIDVK